MKTNKEEIEEMIEVYFPTPKHNPRAISRLAEDIDKVFIRKPKRIFNKPRIIPC